MLAGAAAAAMACPQPAEGFGLRTHLYIAQQVIDDLAEKEKVTGKADCSVTLPNVPRQIRIEQRLCEDILSRQGAFLAGTIGPDAFPDPIVGQSFVHPGKKEGRQTADWLELMLEKADPVNPGELAFAYGNMLHASGDIFAHSYVNNYSGDEFAIFARWQKDVELRHSLIERYIDQRIENVPTTKLEVPAGLVIRTMVRTSYVSGRIVADEEEIRLFLRNPTTALPKLALARLFTAKEATHMAIMRVLLSISERQRVAGPCQEAKSLRAMIDAFQGYVIGEYEMRRTGGVEVGAPPQFPERVEIPSCSLGSGGDSLERQEEVFASASAALRLMEAELEATEERTGIASDDLVESRRKSWMKPGNRSMRKVMKAERRRVDGLLSSYEDAVRAWKRDKGLRAFTDLWAGDVRAAVAAYIEASRKTAEAMIDNNGPYPPPLHRRASSMTNYTNWFACYRATFRGLDDQAAKLHCDQLQNMGGDLSLARASRRAAMGQLPRSLLYALAEFQHELDEFMADAFLGLVRLVNPGIRGLLDMLNKPERLYRDDLDDFFRKGRNGQLTFACVSRWIDADIGIQPQTVHSAPAVNPVYVDAALGWTDHRDGRSKWSGKRGSCSEPRPLRPWVDPERFVPMKHALTMSKLSLLGEAEVEELALELLTDEEEAKVARELGPTIAKWKAEVPPPKRYSILLDAVRSLDGSYPWQGESMPYPRRAAYGTGAKIKGAGYPYPGDRKFTITKDLDKHLKERLGFPYYRNETLRRKVFATLFEEPFEGEILRRPEFNGPDYPFRPCLGDPFRRPGLGHGGDDARTVCLTIGD